jgi:hypothetical protein
MTARRRLIEYSLKTLMPQRRACIRGIPDLAIDAVDDSVKHSLVELLPMSPPEYGFIFMVPVEEAWRYLEPLVDAGPSRSSRWLRSR